MFTFPISFFSTSASNVITLTYVSNGDTNGLVYYLGTNGLTTGFTTPNSSIVVTASTSASPTDTTGIIDRTDNVWYSNSLANQWIQLSLLNNVIKVNKYTIKSRNDSTSNLPRNWKLQGSNDQTTWTDLDTRTSDTTIATFNTWYGFNASSSTSYRYIRFYSTGIDSSGTNFITMNEIELYGELSTYTPTTTTITFDSLGGNDIFYYLGTNKLTTSWVNPSTTSIIKTTASSTPAASTDVITDRSNSDFYTNTVDGSWIKFDFLINKINPNYYVIKSRSAAASNLPRNWKLQGSNNDSTWTDLDVKTNDSTLTTTNQFAGFSCSSSTSYRYIRFLQTGVESSGSYYLTMGEFYIYGDLIL